MADELLLEYKDKFRRIFQENKYRYCSTFTAIKNESKKKVFLKIYDKRLIKEGPEEFINKQIRREEELTKLFNNEKKKCNNIVELYEKIETNISIIFVYEKCDKTLQEYVGKRLQKKKNFFIKIVRSIAKALKELNNMNVIHRDIKPNNIFMKKNVGSDDDDDEIEENCIIKLGDFGSSIKKEENDSIQIGTLLYLPPEIIKNIKYDEKIDLWSLGITLYHLYFGFPPYGSDCNVEIIKDKIYSNNFIYQFSGIPTLDILFKKLIEIGSKKRMTHEELYEYVNSEEFMKPNIIYKEDVYGKVYDEIKSIINTKEYKELKMVYDVGREGHEKETKIKKQLRQIVKNIQIMPQLIDSYYSIKQEEQKEIKEFINILYYNEEFDKNNKEIKEFEKETPGAFIFCNNMDSFKIIFNEIYDYILFHSKCSFNLIINENAYNKFMEILIMDEYIICFNNIYIYSNVNKTFTFKNEKKKQKIFKNFYEFLNNNKSEKFKPFPLNKLIKFEDYKTKYIRSHRKISTFYGNLTKETYKEKINEIDELIKEDKSIRTDTKKNILLKSFQTFDLDNDLEELNKKIIKEYTLDTFYGDLNRWLREINICSFEEVAYFTARLMYSLNDYAEKNSKFFNVDHGEIYRGIELNYSTLLEYERSIGEKILFTTFTSTSIKKNTGFQNIYKSKNNFSVNYYITNLYEKGWISNGIDIHDISDKSSEEEILYQPFSFYIIKNVEIDIENHTGKIYLETIGKEEILEEIIKDYRHIIEYNEKKRIIESIELK